MEGDPSTNTLKILLRNSKPLIDQILRAVNPKLVYQVLFILIFIEEVIKMFARMGRLGRQ